VEREAKGRISECWQSIQRSKARVLGRLTTAATEQYGRNRECKAHGNQCSMPAPGTAALFIETWDTSKAALKDFARRERCKPGSNAMAS
jgi:hypothetical protein